MGTRVYFSSSLDGSSIQANRRRVVWRECVARKVEKRSDDAHAAALGHGGDARKAVEPAAGALAQQIGLGLISRVVTDRKVDDAVRPTPGEQQVITRGAGRRLNIAVGFGAGPIQYVGIDAARAELGRHARGFVRRFGPKSVIDDQTTHPAANRTGPLVYQQGEARLSAPPETATAICGADSNGPSACMQASKLPVSIGFVAATFAPLRHIDQVQPARSRSAARRSRTKADAFSWSRVNRANVAHASSVLSIAANAMPSFRRLSAALLPSGNPL